MLSKRWIINYLLFTLIIVFTWIGYNNPIREDQKLESNFITSIKARDVNRIRIETADQTLELQRRGAQWQIESPVKWPANNVAVERVATITETQPHSQLPSSQIDLATLGLVIPKAAATLNDTTLLFGDTNPIGNRRYLLIGSQVYLVTDIHFALINQGLFGLIDQRLLPSSLQASRLKSLKFDLNNEQGDWLNIDPESDQAAINELINNWQTLPASKVSDYNPNQMPLSKVSATVTGEQAIEFYVLSISPEIIIARPDLGIQYHFPDHRYYGLLAFSQDDSVNTDETN
jgi:hypothetical protein